VNTNNSVKWRLFIVPNKVDQIDDYLIHRHLQVKIKIGMNEMRVNDSEMCVR